MDYRPLIPRRALSVQALYSVHYFEYTSTYAFAGERHDFWEFVYVDSGELLVTAGESSRRLRQGQLIFHAPGEFHALSSAGAAPELVVVSFRCAGEAMDRFLGLVTALGPAERALLARIVAESGAAFSTPLGDPSTRALQRRETVPFGAEQLVCCALEELLIRLVRRETAPRPPRRQLRGGRRDRGPGDGLPGRPCGGDPHPGADLSGQSGGPQPAAKALSRPHRRRRDGLL